MRRDARAPLLSILLLGWPGPAGADAPGACTLEAYEAWKEARETSLGVRASDQVPLLDPSVIPSPSQSPAEACPSQVDFSLDQEGRASDGFHSWIFGHPCKVTLCGEPLGYEENRKAFWFSGEHDLNNNIAVSEDFKAKLDRLLCYRSYEMGTGKSLLSPQEPHLCFPPTETIHVEITPPPRLRPLLLQAWTEEGLYGWGRWKQTLRPPTMCVYGPFVADTGHAARAEIHPTQLFWWRERDPERPPLRGDGPPGLFDRLGRLALFVVQDASGRYSQRHHFVLSRAPAPGSPWRPWASAPLDGTFEIPFWSDPQDPPRFRLEPYTLFGVGGGAPDLVPSEGQPVTAQGPEGQPQTVAIVSNKTRTRAPSRIQAEVQVLCACTGTNCGPGGRTGYLGKVVVRVETGRNREWSEGSQALLLTDDLPTAAAAPAREVTVTPAAEAPPGARQPPPTARSLVTWKPSSDGPAWIPVAPSAEALPALGRAIDAMFVEAEWPEAVARPEPSLWRLASVDVKADAVVEGLPERHRKSRKVLAKFEGSAVELISGVRRPLEPISLDGRSVRFRIAPDRGGGEGARPTERIEVKADIQVSFRDQEGQMRTVPAQAPEYKGIWNLWSFALGAKPIEHWRAAVRALCDHFAKETPVRAGFRPSQDDLRIIVERALKDDRVTVTDLRVMVADVCSVCGRPQEGQRAQPYQVQSQ